MQTDYRYAGMSYRCRRDFITAVISEWLYGAHSTDADVCAMLEQQSPDQIWRDMLTDDWLQEAIRGAVTWGGGEGGNADPITEVEFLTALGAISADLRYHPADEVTA